MVREQVFAVKGPDQLGLDTHAVHDQPQHRVGRRLAPVGGAPRVEDPDAALLGHLRQVRVAVDDGTATAARKPLSRPAAGPPMWTTPIVASST